jgi:ATP-dependent DNA helicase HFM1/MER3
MPDDFQSCLCNSLASCDPAAETCCREKLDALSRRCFDSGSMSFISDVALLLIDEVHVVSEDRGPTLEAGVVCRLQTLGSMPQLSNTNLHSLRIVAASASVPNVQDIACWVGAPQDGCKV